MFLAMIVDRPLVLKNFVAYVACIGGGGLRCVRLATTADSRQVNTRMGLSHMTS